MRVTKIISTMGVAFALTACGQRAVSYELAMCPEPLKISECKTDGRKTFCMVESTAAVPITTYIDTWAYDKNGTSLQGGMLDTIGLYPKERKKAELIFSDKGDVTKMVICSVNPAHPFVAARLKPIQE
ncbi:hypothetical protein ACFQPC_14805 [Herminiimonas glaciei]|uniref:Lipoprotein n=1 Tax=Herminiimonas glaciei TaxID=523788 RepID=A0ABW2IE52_9BURK